MLCVHPCVWLDYGVAMDLLSMLNCDCFVFVIPISCSYAVKYIAAYLLAILGGNEAPSKSDVTEILAAGGIEVDEELLSIVFKNLEGKSVDELIREGAGKFSAISAGAGGAAAPSAAASSSAPAAAVKEEKKKEEPKEEEEVV